MINLAEEAKFFLIRKYGMWPWKRPLAYGWIWKEIWEEKNTICLWRWRSIFKNSTSQEACLITHKVFKHGLQKLNIQQTRTVHKLDKNSYLFTASGDYMLSHYLI
jgi:hypothetical protein